MVRLCAECVRLNFCFLLQIELMGQSLFNLTCLEDYDELKRNLAPDEDQAVSAATSGEWNVVIKCFGLLSPVGIAPPI